jgi:hypothetical protein
MLTVLGLKSSTEVDKPRWRKESYVHANELLNCLLDEYMISRFLKKSGSTHKSKTSKERMTIELQPDGGITGRIYLEQTVVDVL